MNHRLNYCILVAGLPVSGKSTFASWLSQEAGLPLQSKDIVLEHLYDTVGYTSRAEKLRLGQAATRFLEVFADSHMRCGLPFILESDYEENNASPLKRLLYKYGYIPVTVLFEGDLKILYKRFVAKEQEQQRREIPATTMYPILTGERQMYIPMGFERFSDEIEKRGLRRFAVGGELIRVDSTDFKKVNYDEILQRIRYAARIPMM